MPISVPAPLVLSDVCNSTEMHFLRLCYSTFNTIPCCMILCNFCIREKWLLLPLLSPVHTLCNFNVMIAQCWFAIWTPLHYKSIKPNPAYLSLHPGNLRVLCETNAGWADAVQEPVVCLSVNGPWLFEAHCLSASQTLSHYRTGTTGPEFSWLPTSG